MICIYELLIIAGTSNSLYDSMNKCTSRLVTRRRAHINGMVAPAAAAAALLKPKR